MKRYPALASVLGSDWHGNYLEHLERQLAQVYALVKAIYPDAKHENETISLGSIQFKPMAEKHSQGLVGIQVQLPGSGANKTLLRKIKLLQGKIDAAVLKAKVDELRSMGEMNELLSATPPARPRGWDKHPDWDGKSGALDSSPDYAKRVEEYEAQGMSRSDAQGVVDAEDMQRGPR